MSELVKILRTMDPNIITLHDIRMAADLLEQLGSVLQDVIDETAHLDCYSEALTAKIIAALNPARELQPDEAL